ARWFRSYCSGCEGAHNRPEKTSVAAGPGRHSPDWLGPARSGDCSGNRPTHLSIESVRKPLRTSAEMPQRVSVLAERGLFYVFRPIDPHRQMNHSLRMLTLLARNRN